MKILFLSCLPLVWAHDYHEIYAQKPGVVWPAFPHQTIASGSIDYQVGGNTFEGFYAYPSAATEPLPGVVIAHQFMGLGAMEKFRALEWASRGFIAFAIDMFGKGRSTTDQNVARATMSAVRSNTTEFKARLMGSWGVLHTIASFVPQAPPLNHTALFATGYCFGGAVAFELARWNLDGLLGVAGFHPALTPILNRSGYPASMRAAVQAHHAQLDSAGDQGLADFEAEMKARNVSQWSTLKYGNCQHGWTDPTSTIYRPLEAETAHATARLQFAYLLGRSADVKIWSPTQNATPAAQSAAHADHAASAAPETAGKAPKAMKAMKAMKAAKNGKKSL